MDIKLNARLSAYSKVSSLSGGAPSEGIPVSNEQIDQLFADLDDPVPVTKSQIDDLFVPEDSETDVVSKSQIDLLFT